MNLVNIDQDYLILNQEEQRPGVDKDQKIYRMLFKILIHVVNQAND